MNLDYEEPKATEPVSPHEEERDEHEDLDACIVLLLKVEECNDAAKS